MKTNDLAVLKNIDLEYEKIVIALADRYKSEWDDPVHDSYGKYVKQLQDNSKMVHAIRCKAETMEKEIVELNVETLRKRAEDLMREADSI